MYVYVTRNKLYCWGPDGTYEDGARTPDEAFCRGPLELLPEGRKLPVCGTLDRLVGVIGLSSASAAAVVHERHEGLRTRFKADPGTRLDTIERRIPERPFDFSRPGPLPWASLIMSGPPNYTVGPGPVLRPEPAEPGALGIWTSGLVNVPGANSPPALAADTPLRAIDTLLGPGEFIESAHIGDFDPTLIPGFSAASRVPMETYRAPVASGADERSRNLLGGQELKPIAIFRGTLSSRPWSSPPSPRPPSF
ncbi:MAG TPA: hypothetical protein VFC19_31940 [Candidatus Limnocylindrales bacterium]|nr:hypothetical protein [Candidatus Limnocylindrales bacterium]